MSHTFRFGIRSYATYRGSVLLDDALHHHGLRHPEEPGRIGAEDIVVGVATVCLGHGAALGVMSRMTTAAHRLPGVDPARIALWGTSYAMPGAGRLMSLAGQGVRDLARALTQRPPHLLPIVGLPGRSRR